MRWLILVFAVQCLAQLSAINSTPAQGTGAPPSGAATNVVGIHGDDFTIIGGSKPPPGFKFTLGVWLEAPMTPGEFNRRLGLKIPSFEVAVSIPFNATGGLNASTILLDPIPGSDRTYLSNVQDAWDDGTDASVFITVYADQIAVDGRQGLDLVDEVAIEHLAMRLAKIPIDTGRKVYMRWLPEMNGSWMLYGLMSARYVQVWIQMFEIFRKFAPDVVLVWSPNYDLQSGDTSYWPGPQYVYEVGTSAYWKGFGVNSMVSFDYVVGAVSTIYTEYAEAFNKPFVISECGGAWETGPGISPITGASFLQVTNQVDQATFQSSFWRGILSPEIFATLPLLRAAYLFEYLKEEEFLTDFRITNDSSVKASFIALLTPLDQAGYLVWANNSALTAPKNITSSTTEAGSNVDGTWAGVATANPPNGHKSLGVRVAVDWVALILGVWVWNLV